MYIKLKTFDGWLDVASNVIGVSPGGVARDFGVTRQTVYNWIVKDVIDAYVYDGNEGRYIIIDKNDYFKIYSYIRETKKYYQG